VTIDTAAERGAPDLITIEIIQEALQATGDEMFAAYRKTAMSAIIYEVLDMGTGVTAANGDLAASGAGIPSFVGVLDKAVRRVIEIHGLSNIKPGDVFVTNDPTYGGVTHLNDVVLALPVFAEDTLIAWTATIAHFNDVGGAVPGSISTEATEIFQEGVRLPAIKLIDQGQALDSVFRIMSTNSRLPDFLEGDLWAGIAAVRLGGKRLQELVDKYGLELFLTAVDAYLDRGEQVARKALSELPSGRYSLSEEQDNGSFYSATIEITEDSFVVDLRDNPVQDSGPQNASRDGMLISAQMAFMNLTGIEIANAGSFRPITVLTTPGTVCDARQPAAMAIYYEVEIRFYDVMLRCLAPHMEGRIPAGGFQSICGTFIGGRHPDTGRHFTIVEPEVGGWGASIEADGISATFSASHGETFNCPAEVAEARYGLFVNRLELNLEPGGEGRTRGGNGILLEYQVRSDGCFFTCAYTRSRQRPWPLNGGNQGSPNYVEIVRTDGTSERFAFATGKTVNRGDLIRIHTGNGAGNGDPRERDRELVKADIRDWLISAQRAIEVYGPID
jgi:N-methylhydantoinase B